MRTAKSIIESMPETLRKAQASIELPEVREMMKKLAEYNLGVCMPHTHTESEDFAELPVNVIQVEENLRVEFVDRSSPRSSKGVPVAWRWVDDGVVAGAMCVSTCVPTSRQSGGEGHKVHHSSV